MVEKTGQGGAVPRGGGADPPLSSSLVSGGAGPDVSSSARSNLVGGGAGSDAGSTARSSDSVELQRVRARLAAIVDSSEDGIISKTLEGIVTSWNQGAERLFGYTAQEMIGQPIARLIPPEFQHEEADILAQIRRGERLERYDAVRIHKQGHRLNISLTVSPVRDAAGKVVGAAKIAHDVTARRQAEKAFAGRGARRGDPASRWPDGRCAK